MNKKLIYLSLLLLPITIISFFYKKETNFIMPESPTEKIHLKIKVEKINKEIDLEDYIIGVVAGEMPASFEKEALKAQAIASRTYIINSLKNNTTTTGTISDQVYITEEEMKNKWQDNYDKYYSKVKDSVETTKNQIMFYNNEPIKAYYYSMSNGYTESSLNVFNEQNDYLNVIESPFDEDNSYEQVFQKEVFCTKLSINCDVINISDIEKDNSERVSTITINNKQFTGIDIRKKLSLRSTDFEIVEEDNLIKIITKGYGHGVGMSQYGANEMAKLGYTYEEILKYYYQNIEINSI